MTTSHTQDNTTGAAAAPVDKMAKRDKKSTIFFNFTRYGAITVRYRYLGRWVCGLVGHG